MKDFGTLRGGEGGVSPLFGMVAFFVGITRGCGFGEWSFLGDCCLLLLVASLPFVWCRLAADVDVRGLELFRRDLGELLLDCLLLADDWVAIVPLELRAIA